jgi:hypothetical protein
MGAQVGSPEGERLDVLATLVEAYERKHFPMDLPDPVEAIKFRMEQSGLSPKDLVPMIGQLNRVYEILSRKRPLTLAMIRALPYFESRNRRASWNEPCVFCVPPAWLPLPCACWFCVPRSPVNAGTDRSLA